MSTSAPSPRATRIFRWLEGLGSLVRSFVPLLVILVAIALLIFLVPNQTELKIGTVLGFMATVATALSVEHARKPRLTIRPKPLVSGFYDDGTKRVPTLFLPVEVTNEPQPKPFRWLLREPATRCRSRVDFFTPDGKNLFTMDPARWSDTLQPTMPYFVLPNSKERVAINDFRFPTVDSLDIYAAESKTLSLVALFSDDSSCHGWSTESYYYPHGRHPGWLLPQGHYLVRVIVTTAGEETSAQFAVTVRQSTIELLPSDAALPASVRRLLPHGFPGQ